MNSLFQGLSGGMDLGLSSILSSTMGLLSFLNVTTGSNTLFSNLEAPGGPNNTVQIEQIQKERQLEPENFNLTNTSTRREAALTNNFFTEVAFVNRKSKKQLDRLSLSSAQDKILNKKSEETLKIVQKLNEEMDLILEYTERICDHQRSNIKCFPDQASSSNSGPSPSPSPRSSSSSGVFSGTSEKLGLDTEFMETLPSGLSESLSDTSTIGGLQNIGLTGNPLQGLISSNIGGFQDMLPQLTGDFLQNALPQIGLTGLNLGSFLSQGGNSGLRSLIGGIGNGGLANITKLNLNKQMGGLLSGSMSNFGLDGVSGIFGVINGAGFSDVFSSLGLQGDVLGSVLQGGNFGGLQQMAGNFLNNPDILGTFQNLGLQGNVLGDVLGSFQGEGQMSQMLGLFGQQGVSEMFSSFDLQGASLGNLLSGGQGQALSFLGNQFAGNAGGLSFIKQSGYSGDFISTILQDGGIGGLSGIMSAGGQSFSDSLQDFNLGSVTNTLGIRNNNFLNLKGFDYGGLIGNDSSGYGIFETPLQGAIAGVGNFENLQNNFNLNSIGQLAEKIVPANETVGSILNAPQNSPAMFSQFVSQRTGIDTNEPLNLFTKNGEVQNQAQLQKIIQATSEYQNGGTIPNKGIWGEAIQKYQHS